MTALNFPDSPSNGDTYQGYTYNSTKSAWAKPDSPDPDARTAVYANIAALPTSGTAGDMAYVTATNRLYIWTGTGWYNIALINTNPTISGVSSSYALAIDGTATTVTITATDPEGLPITYSIVSDTSGNSATVAQGTGSNTNVFTVTPSTNTAHAGTFSLTFRASDGVNIASSAASFTLQFKVVNQKYTTALITSVGANLADNNDFVDSSTNSHTITAAGNATQNTFSPYRHGGYSTYFDGTGDYLHMPQTSLDLGADNFCVEAWVYTTSTGNQAIIGSYRYADGVGSWNLNINYNSNQLRFFIRHSGGSVIDGQFESGTFPTNQWVHVAVTRDGSNLRAFINGTQAGTTNTALGSNTIDNAITTYRIGASNDNSIYWSGNIADARVVKGTAVYTSNFTPPTERLTAVTNTSLLTCHLPYIADGSTNSHAITVVGNTKTEPFAPYDALEYSAADHGGSMYFDGSGDYVTVPNHTSLDLASNDFTIEFWAYSSNPNTAWPLGKGNASSAAGSSISWYWGGGYSDFYSGSSGVTLSHGAIFPANQWFHVACCRSGNDFTFYLNGVSVATTSTSGAINTTTNDMWVGAYPAAGFWPGTIADFRFVKGTAVYTSNFTPPTAPLTAITNTSLLLKGTDAGIIDKSQSVKTITLNGNVSSSTTQTKYLSSSMYFDGTGDWLTIPTSTELNMGTGDLTVEAWLYQTSAPADYQMIVSSVGSNGNYYITIRGGGTGGQVEINVGGVSFQVSLNNSVTDNTWYHFAATRSSGTWNIFINGTSIGTASSAGAWDLGNGGMYVGRFGGGTAYAWPGYMSDLRITKGLARYTANFTAPTAALQG